jgi:hypothetical protein
MPLYMQVNVLKALEEGVLPGQQRLHLGQKRKIAEVAKPLSQQVSMEQLMQELDNETVGEQK